MVVFQFVTWKSVEEWNIGKVPLAAKVSATLSILAWILCGVLRPRDRLHAEHVLLINRWPAADAVGPQSQAVFHDCPNLDRFLKTTGYFVNLRLCKSSRLLA